jgi:hypothetical protein
MSPGPKEKYLKSNAVPARKVVSRPVTGNVAKPKFQYSRLAPYIKPRKIDRYTTTAMLAARAYEREFDRQAKEEALRSASDGGGR